VDRPLYTGPVTVSVGTRVFDVPHRSAAGWLDILPRARPASLLLYGAVTVHAASLRDDVLDGALSLDDVATASHELLGRITGTGPRWWVGWNVSVIGSSSSTVGAMTLKGADPFRCTLPQWNAAVERLYTDGAKESDRMRWMAATEMPPADAGTAATWDSGMTREQMTAQAARMPGMR
jgi:hypothetical protein